jgi:serine beta-lactamase-like protein LACTB, mitochondrial
MSASRNHSRNNPPAASSEQGRYTADLRPLKQLVVHESRSPLVRNSPLLLGVGAMALLAVATACKRPAVVDPPDAGIDAVVDAFMAARGIVGLGVGIVVNGEVAYVAGYGLADRDADIPVRPYETRFRWASISKTLTAVAALTLDEIGALDLDDPVTDHFPDYGAPPGVQGPFGSVLPLPPGVMVTVRNLLDHRSGIRHYSNGTPGVSVNPPASQRNDPDFNSGFIWAFPLWLDEPLLFAANTGFSYSSPAFNLLGAVVGAAQNARSGLVQSIEQGYLLRVNGLLAGTGAAGIRPDYQWIDIPQRAKGYIADGQTLEISSDSNSDVSWKLPSGGFLSTTYELAEYCGLLCRNALIGDPTASAVYTLGPLGIPRYNLGFYIDARNGRLRVSHGGVQQKVRSHLAFYPAEQLGFVVFSNTYTDAEDEPFWVQWFSAPNPPMIRVSELVDQLEDLVRARLMAGEAAVQTALAD